tara:strand:+ start:1036 stop:1650 length:615 start_codon:yes stop_codon:yes gene_type:complete
MKHSNVILCDSFFSLEKSDEYFVYLKKNIKWKQESMMMYGKKMNFARLTSWYGEDGKSYKFSGIKLTPNNWDLLEPLYQIRKEVEIECGTEFNSVLLNYYRNGQDSISWHSDNEKEFGDEPTIASVSFGCERIFKMRQYYDKSDVHNLTLKHGSLLIMAGETQKYWQHSIPKQKLINKNNEIGLFDSNIENGVERINLTFRKVI